MHFYLGWIGGDDLHGICSAHKLLILQQEVPSEPGRLDPRLKLQVCADISINKFPKKPRRVLQSDVSQEQPRDFRHV